MDALKTIFEQVTARSGTFSVEDVQRAIADNEDLAPSFHYMDIESNAFVRKGTPYGDSRYINTYMVEDRNIAVLNMFGPIYPRASMMSSSSEGVSLQKLATDFAQAYADPSVDGIVLNSDSPGGDARGLGDTAEFLYKLTAKGHKPFLAYASGYMCSAAYYLAAPAHKIISSKSGMVGSIGTVMSVRKGQEGVLDIVSSISPKKRVDAFTDEGYASYKQKVDDLGLQFASDVALFRGVTKEKVIEDYGQGDYMVGPRAKNQGLVDAIGTLASVVEEAASMSKDKSKSYRRKYSKSVSSWVDTPLTQLEVEPLNKEINMGLKDVLTRMLSSDTDETAVDIVDNEQAQPTTPANESAETAAEVVDGTPVLSREELEDSFSDSAELFAMRLVSSSRIVPALKGQAMSDYINAKIDDTLYGGTVNFVNNEGEVVSGTREEQVVSRYDAFTPHTKTQELIKSVKDGSVEAKVLTEIETEKVVTDGPISEERRQELLRSSSQGQSVLANKA